MKRTLRSLSAALAAALALACAGSGSGGEGAAGTRDTGPGLRKERAAATVETVHSTAVAVRLTGGRPALERIPRRAGAPPRLLAGGHIPGLATSDAAPLPRVIPLRLHAGRALRPAFARDLADARDGTLSAHSAGVPPPLPA